MIATLFRAVLFHGLLAASVGIGAAANAETLALVGGKLYAAPEAAALDDAVVVATDGVITAIGSRSDVQIPSGARVIDCTGKTVVAGFWNSHVHFTEPVWRNAGTAPAVPMTAHMQAMLTRWGFTTVWDLGSDGRDTLALRRRVNSGEVPGPAILTAGSIFPKDGHPIYLPAEMKLPMASTPDEAAQWARTFNDFGFDGLKLFTGSFMGSGKPVINMPPDIAKAAVEVAHAAGKPVFAHPQNMAGVDAVIAAGVDITRSPASRSIRQINSRISSNRALRWFRHCRCSQNFQSGRTSLRASLLRRSISSRRFTTMAAQSCSAPMSASPISMTPRLSMN